MRRNTKTMYEWRKAYRDKEELMLERGFPEVSPLSLIHIQMCIRDRVSPHEFYRDLFPEGSLQSAEHDGKGNLIATQIRSAVEPFIATEMSPANREQMTECLESVWNRIQADVSDSRHIPTDTLNADVYKRQPHHPGEGNGTGVC